MSDIDLSVGTVLYVSVDTPEEYDMPSFEALSWTEVGEIASIGEFGGSAQVSQFTPLKTGIVKKRKGSIDYGTAALSIGKLNGDLGQGILKAGFDGANRKEVHSFKVVDPEGNVAYFTGVISSFTNVINDANTVYGVNSNIELDNRVISDMYGTLFTVTFVAGANGSIIGPSVNVVESGGNTQYVYASAASGYEFSSWSDTNTDNPRRVTNVTEDQTMTASFTSV